MLEMEISAPGYVTQIVQYDIKKRRNKVPIFLEKMEIDDSDIEMPSIPFGRDKERDPSMGGAMIKSVHKQKDYRKNYIIMGRANNCSITKTRNKIAYKIVFI